MHSRKDSSNYIASHKRNHREAYRDGDILAQPNFNAESGEYDKLPDKCDAHANSYVRPCLKQALPFRLHRRS